MGKKKAKEMGKPRRGSKGVEEEELHSAARSGDLSSLQSILSSDPLAVNSRDKHSRTPLHLAAWSGHDEIVAHLCDNGADVGAAAVDDMAAIHFAAQKGHLKVVKTLLLKGASLKSTTRKGLTPLHYAVQGSHDVLIQYLLKKGASRSSATKAGKTPLDYATSDEIRSILENFGTESGKGEDEPAQKPSRDEETNLGGGDGLEDKGLKRKGDEDVPEEPSVEPKKKKVVLSHLLAEDDTQEDEEAE